MSRARAAARSSNVMDAGGTRTVALFARPHVAIRPGAGDRDSTPTPPFESGGTRRAGRCFRLRDIRARGPPRARRARQRGEHARCLVVTRGAQRRADRRRRVAARSKKRSVVVALPSAARHAMRSKTSLASGVRPRRGTRRGRQRVGGGAGARRRRGLGGFAKQTRRDELRRERVHAQARVHLGSVERRGERPAERRGEAREGAASARPSPARRRAPAPKASAGRSASRGARVRLVPSSSVASGKAARALGGGGAAAAAPDARVCAPGTARAGRRQRSAGRAARCAAAPAGARAAGARGLRAWRAPRPVGVAMAQRHGEVGTTTSASRKGVAPVVAAPRRTRAGNVAGQRRAWRGSSRARGSEARVRQQARPPAAAIVRRPRSFEINVRRARGVVRARPTAPAPTELLRVAISI